MNLDSRLPEGGRLPRTRGEALRGLEGEIRRSQAEALGRTGERLGRLLDELTRLDRDIDARLRTEAAAGAAAPSGPPAWDRRPPIAALLAQRNRLRDEAARVRHHLVIQREALGLVRHALVDQRYPMPPRRPEPSAPATGAPAAGRREGRSP